MTRVYGAGMKRANITIDDASVAAAKELGGGEFSLGVREAIRIAYDVSGRERAIRELLASIVHEFAAEQALLMQRMEDTLNIDRGLS